MNRALWSVLEVNVANVWIGMYCNIEEILRLVRLSNRLRTSTSRVMGDHLIFSSKDQARMRLCQFEGKNTG